jgi:hypothetical protein
MNGTPSARQRKFQNVELREMFRIIYGGECEIHHIFGSKTKFKLLSEAGIKNAGEWFVIAMSKECHADINDFNFEEERELFMKQQQDYLKHFGETSPVPQEVVDYYNQMTSKHQGLKRWKY